MADARPAPILTELQRESVRRGIGLMVTWHEADASPAHLAMHHAHLSQLLEEDVAEGQGGRTLFGLVTLTGQLLALGAELTSAGELVVLQAIAEALDAPAPT